MPYHVGWDFFSPDPGKEESMNCRACGEIMDVTRNVDGPRGWASAMSGRKSLHDAFVCPHAGRGWHDQLIELLKLIRDTPSQKIADMLQEEVDQVKQTKRSSRKKFED